MDFNFNKIYISFPMFLVYSSKTNVAERLNPKTKNSKSRREYEQFFGFTIIYSMNTK